MEALQDPTQDVSKVELPLVKNIPTTDLTAFLRIVYPLNGIHTKFVHVGLYKQFNYEPGVLFVKQGHKDFVLLDKDMFRKLTQVTESIDFILQSTQNTNLKKNVARTYDFADFQIKIKTVSSKPHVNINVWNSAEKIILTLEEWKTFARYLPCIQRYIEHLDAKGSFMIEHIEHVMKNDRFYTHPPQQLDSVEADRLQDEVVVYRDLQKKKMF